MKATLSVWKNEKASSSSKSYWLFSPLPFTMTTTLLDFSSLGTRMKALDFILLLFHFG
jgi:hypothetical protein